MPRRKEVWTATYPDRFTRSESGTIVIPIDLSHDLDREVELRLSQSDLVRLHANLSYWVTFYEGKEVK